MIDLNCDLGESFGIYQLGCDKDIMPFVSSVNIACGFHAGDPTTMHRTVELAHKFEVNIGAHPGLNDVIGFGRRSIKITPQEAYTLVLYQIGALEAFLRAKGKTLHHVKPHGALYNMAAKEEELAVNIAQAVYDFNPSLILFGLSGSCLTTAGEKLGLKVRHEVFADRTYQDDGSLTPRSFENAVIDNEQQAIEQVVQIVQQGKVKTVTGNSISIKADTICLHGDNVNSVQFAKKISHILHNV